MLQLKKNLIATGSFISLNSYIYRGKPETALNKTLKNVGTNEKRSLYHDCNQSSRFHIHFFSPFFSQPASFDSELIVVLGQLKNIVSTSLEIC